MTAPTHVVGNDSPDQLPLPTTPNVGGTSQGEGEVPPTTPKVAARFWAKVDNSQGPDACWLWTAYVGTHGYGRFKLAGRMEAAHRVSILLTTGAWPTPGMDVDHLCRVTACVNPAHLEVVTHQENNRRGIAGQVNADRQRAVTHCPQGHPYDADNTALRRDGRRRCKACNRASMRRRYDADPEKYRDIARRSKAGTS